MIRNYKIGTLVRLSEGVHQAEIPKHRMGVIVGNSISDSGSYPDIFDVLFFGNSDPLRFHKMHLEIIKQD